MGIDIRYDHSMRIPRPDLSLELGTPNACTHCHDDKTDQWALEYVNKWYGEKKKAHYATILADASKGKPGADDGLLRIINSNLYPEIIRATAIGYLSSYQTIQAQDALKKALNDPDPLLRYTAVENFWTGDSASLFKILAPLMNDPVKSVRMEAANRLATYRKKAFNEIQYALFVKALEEYKRSQEYVADFPMGRHNLGNYYSKLNDQSKAALVKGLGLDPCNFDLLYALFSFHMNLNERVKAAPYAEKMKSCFPGEKQAQDLYNDFARKN